MRTTIELPDDLLRRAKAFAALRGIKLKDLVALGLSRVIEGGRDEEALKKGRKNPPPVMVPAGGRQFQSMSNAEIYELLDRLDEQDVERSS